MPIVTAAELMSLSNEIFTSWGTPISDAQIVSEHLVESNLRGIDSHGVIRIPQYVEDIEQGRVLPGAPVLEGEKNAAVTAVDCGWNFGQVGATKAMEIAIADARRMRVSAVVTRRCNHAGRLGAYVEQAAHAGFLALGFCSSPRHGHFVVPWGGREGRLSTNPIAFGIPAGREEPIVGDFSTSQTAEGKIRLHRNEKRKLPEGWILDGKGNPSIQPSDFYGPPQGVILPFGGRLGYRGYALGLLVEVMGTILAGYASPMDRPGNGVAFIVLDVSALLPRSRYDELIEDMVAYIKSSSPIKAGDQVLLPGELERNVRKERLERGICIDNNTWNAIQSSRANGRGAAAKNISQATIG